MLWKRWGGVEKAVYVNIVIANKHIRFEDKMMTRRLYFLFPDIDHALTVVDDLIINGVKFNNIHSIAREDVDLQKLPPATKFQKSNSTYKIEHFLWLGNLLFFSAAMFVSAYVFFFASPVAALLPLFLMFVCFFVGNYYAANFPHVHMSEFETAISHGEILLMVDVPKSRIREIARFVHKHHPDVVVSGVGWTVEALHI